MLEVLLHLPSTADARAIENEELSVASALPATETMEQQLCASTPPLQLPSLAADFPDGRSVQSAGNFATCMSWDRLSSLVE
jgi:hypothetical protein